MKEKKKLIQALGELGSIKVKFAWLVITFYYFFLSTTTKNWLFKEFFPP